MKKKKLSPAAELGSKGGKAIFKKIGKKGMAELGRRGVAKREANKKINQ